MHVRMGGDVYRAWAVCVTLLRRVRWFFAVSDWGRYEELVLRPLWAEVARQVRRHAEAMLLWSGV